MGNVKEEVQKSGTILWKISVDNFSKQNVL